MKQRMNLQLERESNVALYHQIAEQIKDRIADGRLPPGAQLPTVRQLAAEAGVTRLTIQNAYGELQSGSWIEATVGRGTYVSRTINPARRVANIGLDVSPDAVINDIVQLHDVAGLRSMASASPDATLFPAQEFWSALGAVASDLAAVVNYGSSQGDPDLRIELAKWIKERGIDAEPEQILVTNGAAQGLSLVAQALTRPGDVVAVEQPTYLGFLHTLKAQGLQTVAIPMDQEGLELDALERIITQQRPRFLYTIPTYQNPTGACMSLARRRQLIDLSERYGLIIVEDDIYGRLAFDGLPPPSLKALDRSGLVIHAASFSKLFMPGLRIGYVAAPSPLSRQLLSLRRATDLCSPPLLQRALAIFLRDGAMKRHLRRVLPVYRERRDTAMAALGRYMPPGVTWTKPAGGFCSWLTLPSEHLFGDLLQESLRAGWAFAPGEAFLTGRSAHQHVRLAYGHQPPDAIRSGIEVLAHLIDARLRHSPQKQVVAEDWTPLV